MSQHHSTVKPHYAGPKSNEYPPKITAGYWFLQIIISNPHIGKSKNPPISNKTCWSLHCAHSLARSLTSLTPSLVGKCMIRWLFHLCFFSILNHSALVGRYFISMSNPFHGAQSHNPFLLLRFVSFL